MPCVSGKANKPQKKQGAANRTGPSTAKNVRGAGEPGQGRLTKSGEANSPKQGLGRMALEVQIRRIGGRSLGQELTFVPFETSLP